MSGTDPSRYAFRPVTAADLDLVAGWLAEPHVSRWWGDPASELAAVGEAMEHPRMTAELVLLDGAPIGHIQTYFPHDWGVLLDQPAGTRGIDQFIGRSALVGRGHGPAFIARKTRDLFADGAPRVIVDPDPANAHAIYAYRKAGFRSLGERNEGSAMLLMACDRPDERPTP